MAHLDSEWVPPNCVAADAYTAYYLASLVEAVAGIQAAGLFYQALCTTSNREVRANASDDGEQLKKLATAKIKNAKRQLSAFEDKLVSIVKAAGPIVVQMKNG